MVISDKPVLYPYIIAPTVLVAMSQEAYTKYHPENRHDTLVIIDEDLVKPAKKNNLITVPATRIAEELGRTAVANAVMLGFVVAVTKIIPLEAIKKALLVSVPKGTEKLNLKALERGYAYGLEKLGGKQ